MVFSRIGFHWDYLNLDIYHHLIKTYNLRSLDQEYRSQLDRFIEHITLQEFCSVDGSKYSPKPPAGFKEHVTKHDWKPDTPLKKVIEFREECASQYGVRKCAVWLVGIGKGCVFITLLVPREMKGTKVLTLGAGR